MLAPICRRPAMHFTEFVEFAPHLGQPQAPMSCSAGQGDHDRVP
jgi:hypothetical protein